MQLFHLNAGHCLSKRPAAIVPLVFHITQQQQVSESRLCSRRDVSIGLVLSITSSCFFVSVVNGRSKITYLLLNPLIKVRVLYNIYLYHLWCSRCVETQLSKLGQCHVVSSTMYRIRRWRVYICASICIYIVTHAASRHLMHRMRELAWRKSSSSLRWGERIRPQKVSSETFGTMFVFARVTRRIADVTRGQKPPQYCHV